MSINKNCIYDAGREQFKKSAFSTKLIYSKSPLEMLSKLTKFFFLAKLNVSVVSVKSIANMGFKGLLFVAEIHQ